MELPLLLSFLGGSISSSIAEVCTFPMDMLKTRMQLGGTQGLPKYSGVKQCIQHTYECGGISGFYKGMSAALLRQFSYSGIRICIYDYVKGLMGDDLATGSKLSRFVIGGVCGGFASFVTTPTDVLKIRLVNDPNRLKYKGLMDCIRQLSKEGLFEGFYKGSSPNVYRSLVVNAAELGTYDNGKAILVQHLGMREDSYATRFWASVMAGFVASICSSPIDVVKTRYMNAAKADPTQLKGTEVRFKSPLDCFKKIVANEGPLALYNGFLPLWLRLGPWCTIMFVSWDIYKDIAKKQYLKYQSSKALLE
jgi:hypothetical protein